MFLRSEQVKISEDGLTTYIYGFMPRSQERLEELIYKAKGSSGNLYYLQRSKEGFTLGKLVSYLLYSPEIQFYLRPDRFLPSNFRVERTCGPDDLSAVFALAEKNNRDGLIFPPEMGKNFFENSKAIQQDGFSVQVYHHDQLVGHVSGAKIEDSIFGHQRIYILMRFIVDEAYRNGPVKEFLMSALAGEVPPGSPLFLQVFSDNAQALRFMMRRMNASVALEKWEVDLG